MTQKLYIPIIIFALLAVGVVYWSGSTPSPVEPSPAGTTPPSAEPAPPGTSAPQPAATPAPTPSPAPSPVPATGSGERVVFAIADKAATLTGIRSVLMSVEKLWVRHEKLGWREISFGGPKSYDLLLLRESSVLGLLHDARLPAGTYTEVHLRLGAVTVIPNVGVSQAARLISTDLKFAGRFSAKDNDTAVVIFDFLLDKALHTTTANTYLFAPVVEYQSRNNTIVEITSAKEVKVGGGSSSYKLNLGMDENGVLRSNYALNPNLIITILTNSALKLLNPGESDSGLAITADQAIQLALSGGQLTTALSVRISVDGQAKYWLVSGLKGGAVATAKINAETGAVTQ